MLEEYNNPFIVSFTEIQERAVESALMVLKMHNRTASKVNILALHNQPAWASPDRWVAMVRNYFVNYGYCPIDMLPPNAYNQDITSNHYHKG